MKNLVQNGKSAIVWLCSAHLVCDVYGGFLNPLMPFIASKLGFTMALATVLMAITQICSNMLQPIFGFFADNILKRFFVFWGVILASVFIPLAPSAPNVYLLTLFMILGCLGGSFFHPQSMGFVNYFSGKNCSNNMGVFISLGSLGFAIGPLVAALMVQNLGLDKMFYTSFAGLLLALVMFLFVPKLSNVEKKPEHKSFVASFKEILSSRQMNYLMLIAMMKSLVTNSSCILLPFLWKSMGYSPFYIGFALFLFIFMGGIGSMLSGYLEAKIGPKPVFYISMIGTLPLMYLFFFTYKAHPYLSILIFVMTGFITMLAMPVTMVMAQKIIPDLKSIISGFINGFSWGTVALFMSLVGFSAQKFGIINVLMILAFIPTIASLLVRLLPDEK